MICFIKILIFILFYDNYSVYFVPREVNINSFLLNFSVYEVKATSGESIYLYNLSFLTYAKINAFLMKAELNFTQINLS